MRLLQSFLALVILLNSSSINADTKKSFRSRSEVELLLGELTSSFESFFRLGGDASCSGGGDEHRRAQDCDVGQFRAPQTFSGTKSTSGLPDSYGILVGPGFRGASCLGFRSAELGEIEGSFSEGTLRSGTPVRVQLLNGSGEVFSLNSADGSRIRVRVDRSEYFTQKIVLLHGGGGAEKPRTFHLAGKVFW